MEASILPGNINSGPKTLTPGERPGASYRDFRETTHLTNPRPTEPVKVPSQPRKLVSPDLTNLF